MVEFKVERNCGQELARISLKISIIILLVEFAILLYQRYLDDITSNWTPAACKHLQQKIARYSFNFYIRFFYELVFVKNVRFLTSPSFHWAS